MFGTIGKLMIVVADRLTNFHVIIALAALCLSWETGILTGQQVSFSPLSAVIFSGTCFMYILACRGSLNRQLLMLRNPLNASLFISGLTALIGLFFLPYHTLLIVLFSAVLCMLYIFKPVFGSFRIHIRNIPLLKNLWLALIWTLVTAMLPLSYYHAGSYLSEDSVFLLLRRFFFILAISIPYDIRDYQTDRQNKLHTLPVTLGIGKTKLMALISLMCFGVLVLYSSLSESTSGSTISGTSFAFYISILATGVIITMTEFSRRKYFFSLLLDGTMILQFILVVILMNPSHQ